MRIKRTLSKLEKLERQILLSLPLNRLPLNKSNPHFLKAQLILKKELKRKKLNFFPKIWMATEWFCPDGICGVAVPFYLFHKTILKMEKERFGRVEGENFDQLLKLLRHETGHAFENLYGTRTHPLRIEVFGKSSNHLYPNSYKPKMFSDKYVHHLGEGYAQSHPDEDFAETFAIWLASSKKQWQQKYKDKKHILRKLSTVDKIVQDCKLIKPLKSCTFNEYEPLHKDERTLQQYFLEKSRRFKPSLSLEARRLLNINQRGNSNNKRKNLFQKCLRQNRAKLINELASHIGLYHYQAQKILKPLEREISFLKTPQLKNEKEIFNHLMDTATVEALESLRLRKDRIYL